MNFYIQAGNPRLQDEINFNDESLSDAIESLFILNTESAILMWNHICVPLSYKYDISYMIEDILDLLFSLQKKEFGRKTIEWLPDTFRCNWLIVWNAGNMEIQSKWECTIGHLEQILNKVPCVMLSVDTFLSEWKEVLRIIINGLEKGGYDDVHIKGMGHLREQFECIENFGVLYR